MASYSATLKTSRKRGLLALPMIGYIALFLVGPVLVLAAYSLLESEYFQVTGTFTLANYQYAFGSEAISLLLKTLGIGALAAVLCTTLGFTFAYAARFFLGRWGTRVIVVVAFMLLGGSYLVRVFAWSSILGTEGIVNTALMGIGIINSPLQFLFFGYFAVIVTLVYVYLPFAILPIYAGLQGVDEETLEASRDLGAGFWRTLTRVVVPQSRSAIASAFAFTYILCCADYITPRLVGGIKGQMLGNVASLQFGGAANYSRGAALAVTLVLGIVAGFVVIYLASRLFEAAGRLLHARAPRRESPRPRRGSSRKMVSQHAERLISKIAGRVIVLVGLVFLLVPAILVIVFSFNSAPISGLPLKGLTTHWYSDVVAIPAFRDAFVRSLSIALIAVIGSIAIALPAAFALRDPRLKFGRFIAGAGYAPIIIPGIVFGVSLLSAADAMGVDPGISLTAIAHIAMGIPLVLFIVRARLVSLDSALVEAARDLGASGRKAFTSIVLPLIAVSLGTAALLVAAFSLDDVIVANFTTGTSPTLPVWILGLIKRGIDPRVNAAAVLMLAVLSLIIGLAFLFTRLTNRDEVKIGTPTATGTNSQGRSQ